MLELARKIAKIANVGPVDQNQATPVAMVTSVHGTVGNISHVPAGQPVAAGVPRA